VILSRVGAGKRQKFIQRPLRLVVLKTVDRSGNPLELWLLTDRLELPVDLVALAYQHRWTVELFFRWLKSVLGARHLISHSANGGVFADVCRFDSQSADRALHAPQTEPADV
jgi:IS4 transposase